MSTVNVHVSRELRVSFERAAARYPAHYLIHPPLPSITISTAIIITRNITRGFSRHSNHN